MCPGFPGFPGFPIEAQHWARLSLMLQRLHASFPPPDRIVTTPDHMRAGYATALRPLGRRRYPRHPALVRRR